MEFDDVPVRNQLLAALDDSVLEAIKPSFKTIFVEPPRMLYGADGLIGDVYFPENAVVSLVDTLGDGRTLDVVSVGNEGMAGLSVFLNGHGSTVPAFAQGAGVVRSIDAEAFSRLSAVPGPLHQVMLRYTRALMAQTAQKSTCRATHLLQQRCADWLLMTRERFDANEFPLTLEFLSLMLGVRSTGITLAMRALQDQELIRYARDGVEIMDAAGLEAQSCGCHAIVKAEYSRLLSNVA
jgi:CRP-like cAMP-binding protein